ncbi:hypothetical protein [Streptomyces sp. YU58]|nr:hypothetical protein [Streptomyces coralus]WLW58797.1 hypothetical protein QU709_41830 [Streptomyces coralus]
MTAGASFGSRKALGFHASTFFIFCVFSVFLVFRLVFRGVA